MIARGLCCFIIIGCSSVAFADVYKWEDKNARKNYGDAPAIVTGTERVDLPPPPTKEQVESATKAARDTKRLAEQIEAEEKAAEAKQRQDIQNQAKKADREKRTREARNRANKSKSGFKNTGRFEDNQRTR